MTDFGYARVSTKGQTLDDQINQLQEVGLAKDKIFAEKFTGTTTRRPKFEQLIKIVKPGDTIIVTKLDRLARNTREALNVLDPLMDDGVKFNVLNIGLLDNSTVGKSVKTILLAVAEMERNLIVERTQEGRKWAKAHKPNYKEGRPKRRITPHYHAAYIYLKTHSYKNTSQAFNISVSTLQRIKHQIEN